MTMSYCFPLFSVALCCVVIVSCCILLCYFTPPHVLLRYLMLCYPTSCYAMLSHVTLRCLMLRNDTSCYATLCNPMLFCVMLCSVVVRGVDVRQYFAGIVAGFALRFKIIAFENYCAFVRYGKYCKIITN